MKNGPSHYKRYGLWAQDQDSPESLQPGKYVLSIHIDKSLGQPHESLTVFFLSGRKLSAVGDKLS